MRPSSLAVELLLLAAILPIPPLHAQTSEGPDLDGRVTRVVSVHDFDVNGTHTIFSSNTRFTGKGEYVNRGGIQEPAEIRLGQSVEIWGKRDRKHHTIQATLITVHAIATGDGASVSGIGIIELLPPNQPHAPSGSVSVRADGSLILLTPNTAFNSTLPDPSLMGIHTNTWIAYHGIRRPDGVVIADKASITANVISTKENTLLARTDYDPNQVDPRAKQSSLSKFVKGMDPKQVPPYIDPVMQARIDRIGNSLIPAYQKALPESDLTKVIFRFQLIDRDWPDAIDLPSGIILVPRHIVERLQNDSQLATILADNIATALEKQVYRNTSSRHALAATDIAGNAAGLIVPGLGLVTSLATYGAGSTLVRHELEQSGRVSLGLLNDAGYDITEAPHAWWLLHGKPGQDLSDIPVPARAGYLYETLATNWPARTNLSPPGTP